MKKTAFHTMILAFCCGVAAAAFAQDAAKEETVCFESRKGASEVTKREIRPGLPNVKCSPNTGAALWYGDPFDGTVPMGKMPGLEKLPPGHAVVKPRSEKLGILPMCAPPAITVSAPRLIRRRCRKTRSRRRSQPWKAWCHVKDLQHGRGRIWCLDCHHTTKRDKLVDHFGDPISFDEPQLLCGKCHGDKLRDWRDGIHGKRIGEWASNGKKRWFTCTECQNGQPAS